ncbi:MAG: hypothetical protein AAF570_15710, partial [Bacteroidota bacterium]
MHKLRNLIVFACGLLIAGAGFSQEGLIAPIGEWTAYVSQKSAIAVAERGWQVYCATDGGVFSFDRQTAAKKQITTVDGLSDVSPTAIFGDSAAGKVFVGFGDGMVNVLDEEDKVTYISDIARSDLFTTKRINRFETTGDLLYIATEFGIV